jgi:hypothetical protein
MSLDNNPFRLDPPRLPPAAPDYIGPCLIELERNHRAGRGRWWRPNRAGYTDIFTEAGVYPADEARRLARKGESYVVSAEAALTGAYVQMGRFVARMVDAGNVRTSS